MYNVIKLSIFCEFLNTVIIFLTKVEAKTHQTVFARFLGTKQWQQLPNSLHNGPFNNGKNW